MLETSKIDQVNKPTELTRPKIIHHPPARRLTLSISRTFPFCQLISARYPLLCPVHANSGGSAGRSTAGVVLPPSLSEAERVYRPRRGPSTEGVGVPSRGPGNICQRGDYESASLSLSLFPLEKISQREEKRGQEWSSRGGGGLRSEFRGGWWL